MGRSMTPDQYFQTFVLGNYDDFTDRPDCVRRGFNAAIAASHMADHYFKYFKQTDPARVSKFQNIAEYVEYVSEQTLGHFKDVRSVANAYKHLYTWENVCISSTGAIEAVQIKDEDVSEVTFTHSEITNKLTVVFTRKTGEQLELLPALKSVVDFWWRKIEGINESITIVPPADEGTR